jgi:hypothetical protein
VVSHVSSSSDEQSRSAGPHISYSSLQDQDGAAGCQQPGSLTGGASCPVRGREVGDSLLGVALPRCPVRHIQALVVGDEVPEGGRTLLTSAPSDESTVEQAAGQDALGAEVAPDDGHAVGLELFIRGDGRVLDLVDASVPSVFWRGRHRVRRCGWREDGGREGEMREAAAAAAAAPSGPTAIGRGRPAVGAVTLCYPRSAAPVELTAAAGSNDDPARAQHSARLGSASGLDPSEMRIACHRARG